MNSSKLLDTAPALSPNQQKLIDFVKDTAINPRLETDTQDIVSRGTVSCLGRLIVTRIIDGYYTTFGHTDVDPQNYIYELSVQGSGESLHVVVESGLTVFMQADSEKCGRGNALDATIDNFFAYNQLDLSV